MQTFPATLLFAVAQSVLAVPFEGSSNIEKACTDVGVPPRESKKYDFYLGIALCRAAELRRPECISTMLKSKEPYVDANIPDHNGLTALAHASSQGDKAIFAKLLPRTDVQCAKTKCSAPLLLASENDHPQLVAELLDTRANIEGVNAEGHSPLHLASARGHRSVVELLLTRKAEVDKVVEEDGRVPLHRAATHGHVDVVKLLLAAGAKSSRVDAWKRTAADLAQQQGHADVLKLLDAGSGSKFLHKRREVVALDAADTADTADNSAVQDAAVERADNSPVQNPLRMLWATLIAAILLAGFYAACKDQIRDRFKTTDCKE